MDALRFSCVFTHGTCYPSMSSFHVILSGRTRAGGTQFVRRVSTKRQRDAKDLYR